MASRSFINTAVDSFIASKRDYLNEHKFLKKRIISEVTAIFRQLKDGMTGGELINHPEVKIKIEALESILEFRPETYFVKNELVKEEGGYYPGIKRRRSIYTIRELDTPKECRGVYALPEQHDIAVDRLKELFYAVLTHGGNDLVTQYVESFSSLSNEIDDPTGKLIHECLECFIRIPERFLQQGATDFFCPKCEQALVSSPQKVRYTIQGIHLFNDQKFVPSYFKLHETYDVFWASTAGAWDILSNIGWNWPTDRRDYFRKKDLRYDNANDAARSMDLLLLDAVRKDVLAIQEKRYKDIHLLTRRYVEDSLQAILTIIPGYNNVTEDEDVRPKTVGLRLEEQVRLRLTVEWLPDIIEVLHLHSFQDDEDSIRCIFFADLLENVGCFVPVGKKPAGEIDARRYLRDGGLVGVLQKLFIEQASKEGAALRTDKVVGNEIEINHLKKLLEKIAALDSLGFA